MDSEYIMKLPLKSLLVLLCISISTALVDHALDDEPARLEQKTINVLAVGVEAANRTLVSQDLTISMDMNRKSTHTFNFQVVCFSKNDSKCVTVELSDGTNVVVIEAESSVCVTCGTSDILAESDIENNEKNTSRDTVRHFANVTHASEFIEETRLNVTVESLLIGVATIRFGIKNQSGIQSSNYINNDVEVEVKVIREPTMLDLVFNICIYFVEVFEMFIFGTQLDFGQLKKTFRTPFLPFIGFVCQYIGMPLIAFTIAKFTTSQPLAALGIFVAGICPGGGGSNIYTYLLGGDLPLSITMTTISTVMSLGMMPLWLYTLGGQFLENETTQATIPYTDILITLSIILVPLAAGILIHHNFPRAASIVEKVF